MARPPAPTHAFLIVCPSCPQLGAARTRREAESFVCGQAEGTGHLPHAPLRIEGYVPEKRALRFGHDPTVTTATTRTTTEADHGD